MLALVALAISGCAYKAEPIATPALNVVTSFSQKAPGSWLLYADGSRLIENVRSSDFQCSAHNFPLDFSSSFSSAVRQTLANVVERPIEAETPVPGDRAKSQGARGTIKIRGETIQSRLRVVPRFWSANIVSEVDISASVIVDGPSGRLFGKTVDGRGKGDTPAGFACAGGPSH